MKILLVEDDPLHANFLRETIEHALPEVGDIRIAPNGLEGERAARAEGIGAVVMDLQMKERNGIDAARTIWAERPETRILFWSNYADEAYERGISRIVPKDSAYGYVLKTASIERLALVLRAVLIEGQIVIDREIHRLWHDRARPARGLTDSEHAVLMDIALGLTDRAIAERQGLSLRTVQNRLLSLYDKLGVEDDGGAGLINKRSAAVSEAFLIRAINVESLQITRRELAAWLRRRAISAPDLRP